VIVYNSMTSGMVKRLVKMGFPVEDLPVLISYFYLPSMEFMREVKFRSVFLDSGAISIYSGISKHTVQEYGEFLKEHGDYFDCYAGLDVLYEPEKTEVNQNYLESLGLEPLPTYHYGTSFEPLEKLLERYDYVGVGGMASSGHGGMDNWLRKVFVLVKKWSDKRAIKPLIKIHSWGSTNIKKTLLKYPFYSSDSSNAAVGANAFGLATTFHPRRMKFEAVKNSTLTEEDLKKKKWIRTQMFDGFNKDKTGAAMERFTRSLKAMMVLEQQVTDFWRRNGIEFDDGVPIRLPSERKLLSRRLAL
jgi:hypothetical protein